MAYVKTTPKEWVKILCENGYASAAGAKKSVGRLAWGTEAKDYARVIIDLFFSKKKVTTAHIDKLTELVDASPVVSKKKKAKKPVRQHRSKGAALAHEEKATRAIPATPPLVQDFEAMVSSTKLLIESYGIAYESFGGEELAKGAILESKQQVLDSISGMLPVLEMLCGTWRALVSAQAAAVGSLPSVEKVEDIPEEAKALVEKIKTALPPLKSLRVS